MFDKYLYVQLCQHIIVRQKFAKNRILQYFDIVIISNDCAKMLRHYRPLHQLQDLSMSVLLWKMWLQIVYIRRGVSCVVIPY